MVSWIVDLVGSFYCGLVIWWDKCVDFGDWDVIVVEVSEYGGVLLFWLIIFGEVVWLCKLYVDDGLFCLMVDMVFKWYGVG